MALALWYFDGNYERVMKSSLTLILLDLCVPIGNLFAGTCSLETSMKMYLHNKSIMLLLFHTWVTLYSELIAHIYCIK